MPKLIGSTLLVLGVFIIVFSVCYSPTKEVCLPLHINLKASMYNIIKIDTISIDTSFIYKHVTYREKRGRK